MSARFRFPAVLLGAAFLVTTLAHAQTNGPAAASTAAPAPAATTPAAAGTAPKTSGPTTPADASRALTKEAIDDMNKPTPDIDGALAKLTEALRLNPHSDGAYVLRASLYCQKQMWPQAAADFTAASQLAPGNVVLKFNIVEVKFMQKQYDAARPGYVALESDPDMGDFASYKVFLCDLAGGHTDLAAKELAAFNKAGGNPSYYFSNAAWSINHGKYDEACTWLQSASDIYPPRKNAYYAEGLIYLGYLPLKGGTPGSLDGN